MGNYTFEKIKNSIFKWSQQNILPYMGQHDEIEVSKNNNDILILDFSFNSCLAQLTVSESHSNPYQFVFFEAATLESERSQSTGKMESIYFFYDTANMTEKIVIDELGIAIEYCSCYVPDQLIRTYLKKRGILKIEYDRLYHIVHPSDIKKIDARNEMGEFICKDICAQYLVVENEIVSLRIRPENFLLV